MCHSRMNKYVQIINVRCRHKLIVNIVYRFSEILNIQLCKYMLILTGYCCFINISGIEYAMKTRRKTFDKY
jgi:hypothetical protein